MVLDLRRIFVTENEVLPIEVEFDFSDTDLYGTYPLKRPVQVKGSISNRAGIVTLDINCSVEYSAGCDRCGEDTVKIYDLQIERVLVNKLYNGENDTMILLEDFKLDLRELCFTEVILGLPTKHLCSEDCKGICQKCGKNLNTGNCNCTHKEIDPRLAVLTQLLDQ